MGAVVAVGVRQGSLLILRAITPRGHRAVSLYMAGLAVVEAEAFIPAAVPLFLGDTLARP